MTNEVDIFPRANADTSTCTSTQQQECDKVDLDGHVTDSYLVITGNCDLDNSDNCECKPSNVNNKDGDCKTIGMCAEKQRCISQIGGYFGFVPETPLKLYEGPSIHWKEIPSILQAHALVKNSGTHNYLNVEYWLTLI